MKTSPTQRTLAYLRKQGMLCGVTEKWNQFAHIRQDLFGFIDIVAISPDHGIVGVQCTVDGSRAARRAKIAALPSSRAWLAAGGRIWLVTWGLHGERGKRKVWTVNVEIIDGAEHTTPAIENVALQNAVE